MEIAAGEVYAGPRTHDRVLEILRDLAPGSRILDAACGSGAMARRLTDLGFNVTGVDLADSSIVDPSVTYVSHDLDAGLPADLGTFDAVVSIETIEHLWNAFSFLSAAARHLAPNGRLVVTTPNTESYVSRLMHVVTGRLAHFDDVNYRKIHHVQPCSPATLTYWLQEHGFDDISMTTNGAWIPFTRFRPRTSSLLLGQVLIVSATKRG